MSPAAEPRPARRFRAPLVALLTLVLVDVAVRVTLIHDGSFLGHPVPPFQAIMSPGQRAWAEELAAEKEVGMGRFDELLGWTWKRPAASEDGQITVGPQGTRGPRVYDERPPEGTLRLLFFGDSFTFCEEIGDTKSFQYALERDHPEIEALNFGVSGFGTDQAFLRYRRVGKDRGAHGVFLGILLENIGRNVNRYRPLWSLNTSFCGIKPRFVLGDDGELTLLPHPIRDRAMLRETLLDGTIIDLVREHEYWLDRPHLPTGRFSGLARIAGGWLAQLERSPPRLWNEPAGEPFRVTLAILEAFHREALADGAEFAPVLVFASREDVLEYALPGRPYWGGFYAELERRGLPYIDTADALARRQREIQESGQKASLFWGGHLSGVGNAVVAGEIHRWLLDNEHLSR